MLAFLPHVFAYNEVYYLLVASYRYPGLDDAANIFLLFLNIDFIQGHEDINGIFKEEMYTVLRWLTLIKTSCEKPTNAVGGVLYFKSLGHKCREKLNLN